MRLITLWDSHNFTRFVYKKETSTQNHHAGLVSRSQSSFGRCVLLFFLVPRNMGLAGDDDLVILEDGLIQAGELGVGSSKREREREVEEEEENSAAKRQRYNTMTEIIN